MRKIVFATNNAHKLEEVRNLTSGIAQIICLSEIGCTEEIPETGITLQENASQKSHFIYNKYGIDCFADDTGLEIDALEGRPGVYSARYAGEGCSFEDNTNKVLNELENITNRSACFRTVISLILNGKETLFEGRVDGKITIERSGIKGFGYDPVFVPDGYMQTFAEMPLSIKNSISHRGLAIRKMIDFLKTL
jgi:XTP/dITP diphosphohydrolase